MLATAEALKLSSRPLCLALCWLFHDCPASDQEFDEKCQQVSNIQGYIAECVIYSTYGLDVEVFYNLIPQTPIS